MGADRGPEEIIRGAIQAAASESLEVVLVGPQAQVEAIVDAELRKTPAARGRVSIANATEIVGMTDQPSVVARGKRNSSIVVGLNLIKSGAADAFVSAGNSGAVMAAALFTLGRIKGIERPAIGTIFPTLSGKTLLIDMGANVDCKPVWLLQFAQMGAAYMERLFAIQRPRVALLSNGEEESKGSQLTQDSYKLLKTSGLNFVGNLEGKDIPRCTAHVLVTDGFTGNVMVKLSEGVGELIVGFLKEAIGRHWYLKLGALLLSPAFHEIARRVDYAEYGGAPLLGVNGVVVIAHGRSSAKAIKNAVRIAAQAYNEGLVPAISGQDLSPQPIEQAAP